MIPKFKRFKITNKRTKKARKSEMTWKFAVKKDGVKQIEAWSNLIKVAHAFTYWHGISKNPKWNSTTSKMIKVAELLRMGKFVHIKFIS